MVNETPSESVAPSYAATRRKPGVPMHRRVGGRLANQHQHERETCLAELRPTLEGLLREAISADAKIPIKDISRDVIINRLNFFLGHEKAQLSEWMDNGFPKDVFCDVISTGVCAHEKAKIETLNRINGRLLVASGAEHGAGRS